MTLAHCAGTRRGCVPSGEGVGTSPSMFPPMARGLEMRALDGVSTRSLAVSGVDLLHRSNAMDLRMGTVQGIYSWGSALGDGDLMRRRFRVGCGCFFLGGRGRGRGVPGRVLLRSFRRTAGSKQPCLCYILYVEQWRFRCIMSSGHRERGFFDPRTPWADACDVSGFNNSSTCSHSDDSGGAATPRSTTDSTE